MSPLINNHTKELLIPCTFIVTQEFKTWHNQKQQVSLRVLYPYNKIEVARQEKEEDNMQARPCLPCAVTCAHGMLASPQK